MAPRRQRKNPLLQAEVSAEDLRWLDSLSEPGEKPNRSFHTRRALRWYREGGPAEVAKKLQELHEARARAAPVDEQALRLGTQMLEVKAEARAAAYFLGRILSEPDALALFAEVAAETFSRRAAGTEPSAGTERTPKRAATRKRGASR